MPSYLLGRVFSIPDPAPQNQRGYSHEHGRSLSRCTSYAHYMGHLMSEVCLQWTNTACMPVLSEIKFAIDPHRLKICDAWERVELSEGGLSHNIPGTVPELVPHSITCHSTHEYNESNTCTLHTLKHQIALSHVHSTH